MKFYNDKIKKYTHTQQMCLIAVDYQLNVV